MEFTKLLVLTLAILATTCAAVEAQGQILRVSQRWHSS